MWNRSLKCGSACPKSGPCPFRRVLEEDYIWSIQLHSTPHRVRTPSVSVLCRRCIRNANNSILVVSELHRLFHTYVDTIFTRKWKVSVVPLYYVSISTFLILWFEIVFCIPSSWDILQSVLFPHLSFAIQ